MKDKDLLTPEPVDTKDTDKHGVERQKSLIIRTKEVEIAQLKLETLNIYVSILVKLLLLLLMVVIYLEWDTIHELWITFQE
ncbi:hypothetical protein [Shewanella sp. GXUN23E]|uniref:hypothetical protein n=1 Tax=Shewanella sp. GXUN23E TaxID=3422498 RepID=UPI003D7DDFAD